MHQPGWIERARLLLDRRVVAVVLVGLAVLVGYQVYAQRQAHKVDHTAAVVKQIAPRVIRLTRVQCTNSQLFYDFFNALAEDSSPRFGSPPDGPIIPGARRKMIERLYDAERVVVKPLRKQGCRIAVPAPTR